VRSAIKHPIGRVIRPREEAAIWPEFAWESPSIMVRFAFMDEALAEQNQREFAALMQRVRAGDEDAAWELLDEYGPHIIRVIRRVLTERMRSKADSSDFAQAVWASFYRNRSMADRFDRPEVLMAYLARIARNKVIDEFRRQHQTKKHNIDRVLSLDGSAKFEAQGLVSDEMSPSQVARGNEWIYGLPEHYLRLVRMRQSGLALREIADAMGMHERTVRRVLNVLKLEV
jgi:RNA polymerase sigma-70 factor (ECF subfamily)